MERTRAIEETAVCPWCRTAKHTQTSGTTLKAFFCRKCRREFESVDDGDVGYGRPSKRMEREELRARRKAVRR